MLEQSNIALSDAGNSSTATEGAVKWEDGQSAFENKIRIGIIVNLGHKNVASFLEDAAVLLQRHIKKDLENDKSLKINAALFGEFLNKKGEYEALDYFHMASKSDWLYRYTNFDDWFDANIKTPIMTELEEFQKRGSGWTLSRMINLTVSIKDFVRLPESSSSSLPDCSPNKKARTNVADSDDKSFKSSSSLPSCSTNKKPCIGASSCVPEYIKKKKACINVADSSDESFQLAIISCLHPTDTTKKNPCRKVSYEQHSNSLKLENITMPIIIEDIPSVESQNNISINVFKLKDQGIVPLYTTESRQSRHVNLLQTRCNNDDEADIYHYLWIKNMSRLLSSQINKNEHRKYICDQCLNYFRRREDLDKHLVDCCKLNKCKITMPEKGKKLFFEKYRYKVRAPFIIYADLECVLKPHNDRNMFQKHHPCSIGYYVKCSYDDELSVYKWKRGEACMKWFTTELHEFAKRVNDSPDLPMEPLTEIENQQFSQARNCHICEKPFLPEEKPVKDHCHFTGKYRGPAHNGCNLNFKKDGVIPVVFHNLSGYDSHFIIRNLASDFEGHIRIIADNEEKYISFTKHVRQTSIKFRFIDSFRFMSTGLDQLASNLETHPVLRSEFGDVDEEKFELLKCKGVYPYDYIDSFERFEETALPSMEKFYSKLNDSNISDDEYARAERVWEQFGIENLGEYADLYLKTDVLLLADIFEQFRSTLLESHGLDPAHYYSTPGYTWDAMLKFTRIELELLTDVDMLMFIERGIRGGLSQCSKRYAKANNKYMRNYDPTQRSMYLLYTDVNNLYGWAMSERLPHEGFTWISDVEKFNVMDISDDSSKGYILEVDLEYPAGIHNDHSDIPFCPAREISKSKQEKLMATLNGKTRYVIHYRKLKQALTHGLNLVKIHRVLEFRQAAWLKPYIDLNTQLRTNATNDFEKDLYKLLNNAVYGKTMENVRNYKHIRLISKWKGRYGAEKSIRKPEFKSCTILNENLVLMQFNKAEIKFTKPIYVGMSVLDISKMKVYEFHYDYMRHEFGNKCKLCYTDTDSLIYELECEDIYEVIRRDCRHRFDTSDYPEGNKYGIPSVNKKVPGMMKDELNGKIMTEFVALRSKCYAYRTDEEGTDEVKKAKGVKKNVVKTKITFQDYFECLQNFKEKRIEQNVIRSVKHTVYSAEQQRIALSPHDDKRYLKPDSYETLPWGHFEIVET